MAQLISKPALPVWATMSSGNRRTVLLIGGTILVYHTFRELLARIPSDGFCAGLKRGFFALLRKVPSVRREIDEQMAATTKSLRSQVGKLYTSAGNDVGFVLRVPSDGLAPEDVLGKVKQYMALGEYCHAEQRLSGASYFTDDEVQRLYTSVYDLTLWTNPLHYEVFPGICKMEAELVRMACDLFGDSAQECCGTLTSGGTESILLAVKAYRDYAVQVKGIPKPEILVPVTAHAAFDKAAQLLAIRIRKVPVNPESFAVDTKRLEKMITGSTCMIVGSAPAYPHGCMDDIVEIGRIGQRYGVPVHVDACLGGMLLAFMGRAGFSRPAFDFQVEGVSSISADTHKYGFTPKGSSLLLFRDSNHRRHQYFTEVNWPGGLYASSTLAGSRSGAAVAACWTAFLHFGAAGYAQATREILETAAYIKKETSAIDGLDVMGDPHLSIIAWSSSEFDIYSLYDAMNKKGWTLNALQFPPAIHICISHPQAKPEIAARFVQDMKRCVEELRKSGNSAPADDGAAAIYGSSQKVPFRELVQETACVFLDTLSETKFNQD